MDCNVPTDIAFSFTGFALRGGKTGPHADGWGVALYEGKFARSFLEPKPACESAHGRLRPPEPHQDAAGGGARPQEDARPQPRRTRTLSSACSGGGTGCSRTTGRCPGEESASCVLEQPLGETDSEHAFCWMLERSAPPSRAATPRTSGGSGELIAALGGELGAEGKFNFLLADGRHLYARCGTKLCYIIRQAPFGRATLRDAELAIDFSAVTTRARPGRRRLDRAAHARRGLAAGDARAALGVRSRRAAGDAAERHRRSPWMSLRAARARPATSCELKLASAHAISR